MPRGRASPLSISRRERERERERAVSLFASSALIHIHASVIVCRSGQPLADALLLPPARVFRSAIPCTREAPWLRIFVKGCLLRGEGKGGDACRVRIQLSSQGFSPNVVEIHCRNRLDR